ncbi:MAG: sigma-70 family RNA polymerase sigma factor [Caldilineaceae bacterium]|nr:sigma-70 family RNA polymerase sigma factor [Caldilineaceae bacterium]MCB0105796.1 sigma-70 family RNA polymerase sigma factor [Caldilineaceae bacterium]
MKRSDLTDVVHTTVAAQQWPLTPADCDALTAAVAPFVAQEERPTASTVQRIVINYYHDGPMVEAMRAPGQTGEALWQEWRAYMVSLANSKGIYGEAADDLAQEAYLQTVRALANFRFGSRLKTYFCGIFLNCYRHWVRSATRQDAHEEGLPIDDGDEQAEERLPWLVDQEAPPEEAVVTQMHGGQIATLVHEEIAKLTKSQDLQILRWYYVEQRFVDAEGTEQKWTDDRIGQQLDLPLNTVTSRRLRAVRRLKNHPRLQELFAELTE